MNSLFIDPLVDNIEQIKRLGVNAIEIHTGSYANSQNRKNNNYLKKIKNVVQVALNNQISVNNQIEEAEKKIENQSLYPIIN